MRSPAPPFLPTVRAAALVTVATGLVWSAARAAAPESPRGAPPGPGPALRAGPAADSISRYEGEYGLWVTLDPDSVTVRWLTPGRKPGRLEALAGEDRLRSVRRAVTPRSGGHRVSIPRPDAPRLLLRYGAGGRGRDFSGGPPFETEIRLDEPHPAVDRAGGVDSLYVVGDVHGEYDRLQRLLRNAGLVDRSGRWAGGRSHLVFVGDVMDRGPDVRRTLWFLYRLQREAAAAGGRVHTLLGNHEVMVMVGDHRYVASKERLLARLYGVPYGSMYDPARSVLGRWIASWPVALEADGVLITHGGIGPAYRSWSVAAMNDSIRRWTNEALFRYWADTTRRLPTLDSAAVARRVGFFFGDESPLWFRGFARTDTLGGALRQTLAAHDASLHVIAHTPVPEIRHAYGDSVLLVDLRRPASELLLLVRDGAGYRRWAIPVEGEPRRISPTGE